MKRLKTSRRKAGRKPPAALPLPAGTIHRSLQLLSTALEELGARMPPAEVERIGIIINQAMTAQARSFHTPEHVFDLVEPANPYTTLAALFHDLVYYHVDHGFIPQIAEAVDSSIEIRSDGLYVRPGAKSADRQLALSLAVFGFQPGQKLEPFSGMNEFLSALVMNRKLGTAVREEDLILSTACIEATIPFRMPGADGVTPAEHLELRLETANRAMGIGISRERIRQGVRWAVSFANRDVANFGEKEVTRFLDNTWKLLPESNPSLRTQGVYSIKSYRVALQGMEGFLRTLDPRTIFARYRDTPPAEEYRRLEKRGERNVTTARAYLGIKLLTAAILEALAMISGGDAPVALFMGELEARQKGSRLEDYLPAHRPSADLTLDPTLRDLLANGRASASRFDLQNSPLSLFIYLHLGADGVRTHLDAARQVSEGTRAPKDFLDSLPGAMIAAIAEGCGHMAFTRGEALMTYAASRRVHP
ncbi:MAG: hypothetical protein ACHQ1F_04200 [Spirochaetia bacterium]